MVSVVTGGAAGEFLGINSGHVLIGFNQQTWFLWDRGFDNYVQSHELHTFPAMLSSLFSLPWRLIQTFRDTCVPWPIVTLPVPSPKLGQRSYMSGKMPTLYYPSSSPFDLARLLLSQCLLRSSSTPFLTSTSSLSTLSFFTLRSNPFSILTTPPLPPSDKPVLPSWSPTLFRRCRTWRSLPMLYPSNRALV